MFWIAILNFFWIEFQGSRSKRNRLHQDLPVWTGDLHCRWDYIYWNLFKFHKFWTVSSSQVRIFYLMFVGSYSQQGWPKINPKQKNTNSPSVKIKMTGFFSLPCPLKSCWFIALNQIMSFKTKKLDRHWVNDLYRRTCI